MKFLLSILLSVNAHVWTLSLASLSGNSPVRPARPAPAPMEVMLIDLSPAARAGKSLAPRAAQCRQGSVAPARPSRGPSVRHRIRRSRSPAPRSLPAASAPRLLAGYVPVAVESVLPSLRVEPPSSDQPGGDIRARLAIIQARINAITPLMQATAAGCRAQSGLVRVVLRLNPRGYPCGHRIIDSTAPACLLQEVDTILHMGEPYPYLAGPIPITVRFGPTRTM